ncbi:hypothetical protein PILCRDRAFT_444365 [Piloderma croceum F 1598]|uniref:Uncharacterized protein n=1 Tax=Piloderma croceum (strain F 1598) TaxID=765440 RepID=A0A0C3FVF8_PILCF|nr:hypothetical protein PILCRDRAFT_444365 [Piloderma croceum F 1598]
MVIPKSLIIPDIHDTVIVQCQEAFPIWRSISFDPTSMSLQTNEQTVHDRINLSRLVKRLENLVTNEDWSLQDNQHSAWIKTQGTLQKIKYARRLLKNVEADDPNPSSPKSAQRYRDIRMALDKTEEFILAVDKRVAPKRARPQPILPTIPIPQAETSSEAHSPDLRLSSPGTQAALADAPPKPSLPTDDLLLSPSETSALPSVLDERNATSSNPSIIDISASPFPLKPTKSTISANPSFMPNSNALQQELSDQLAYMATQLKRNAIHFSESLAKDQAVVEEAQGKIEGNFDVMQKERLRVRDLRGKTGSTTCLVVMSVVAVLIAFVIMVLVIRAT